MSFETKPVFAGSDEASHWTCPAAPGEGMTHHLIYPSNTCRYCKLGRGQLVARHRELLKKGARP